VFIPLAEEVRKNSLPLHRRISGMLSL